MTAVACAASEQFLTFTSDGTWRSLPFPSADVIDTDSFHSPSTDNTRFYVPSSGLYLMFGWFGLSDIGGARDIRIRVDGSDDDVHAENGAHATSTTQGNNGPALLHALCLDEGQYVELQGRNGGGGTPNNTDWTFVILKIPNGNGGVFVGDVGPVTLPGVWGFSTPNLVTLQQREDDDAMKDSTNHTRINIPATGLYFVGWHTNWEANLSTDDLRQARIKVNGGSTSYVYGLHGVHSSTQGGPVSAGVMSLAAGDYLELDVNHTGSGNQLLKNCSLVVFPITTGAHIYRSADLGVGHLNDITWDAEDTDADGYHAANAAPFIVPSGKSGIHLLLSHTRSTNGTFSGGHFRYKTGAAADRHPYFVHSFWTEGSFGFGLGDLTAGGADDRRWLRYWMSDGLPGTVFGGRQSHYSIVRLEEFTYGPVRCGGGQIVRY